MNLFRFDFIESFRAVRLNINTLIGRLEIQAFYWHLKPTDFSAKYLSPGRGINLSLEFIDRSPEGTAEAKKSGQHARTLGNERANYLNKSFYET